jgi:hypothetical protein
MKSFVKTSLGFPPLQNSPMVSKLMWCLVTTTYQRGTLSKISITNLEFSNSIYFGLQKRHMDLVSLPYT